MVDLASLVLGASFSVLSSLAVFKYQNWKKDVSARVRFFLQARRQIYINSTILNQTVSNSKALDLLLGKVSFLKPYPYADFYLLDANFQNICAMYEKYLALFLSGNVGVTEFNLRSDESLQGIQGLITLWNDYLRRYLLLYFLLPFLLKKITEKYLPREKSYWDNQR